MPESLRPRIAPDWLVRLLSIELTLIAFFIPAGRFHINLGFYQFTTGYDAYKTFPILFVTWLAYRLLDQSRRHETSALALPGAAFVICTLLAGVGSPDAYQALTETLEIICYALFFRLLLDMPRDRLRWRWVAGGFVVGNLYLAGRVAWQVASKWGEVELLRVPGTFDHPNALGVYAVLGAGGLLWLAGHCRGGLARTGLFVLALAIAGAGVLSLARTATAGLLLFGLVWVVLGTGRQRVLALLLMAGVGALASGAVIDVGARFAELMQPEFWRGHTARWVIWALMLGRELPELPLFGVGLGPVLQERLVGAMASARGFDLAPAQWGAHNLYLELLLGTGLAGLLAFLWLNGAVFGVLWRLPRWERAILAAVLAAFLAQMALINFWLVGNIPVAVTALFAIAVRRAQTQQPEAGQ